MKKILLLLLMIFLIGAVSATADIMDFKSPKGFDEGYGGSMSYEDYSIIIESYDKDLNYDDYFESDDFKKVDVKGNFTEVTDDSHDEVGVIELIEIGKEQYVVKCMFDAKNTSEIDNCIKYLKEFNEKNNLTPIAPK